MYSINLRFLPDNNTQSKSSAFRLIHPMTPPTRREGAHAHVVTTRLPLELPSLENSVEDMNDHTDTSIGALAPC